MIPLTCTALRITTLVLVAVVCTLSSAAVPPRSVSFGASSREAHIAFFVQISESSLTLLPRLLRTIWHADNLYVVHFDKKIPAWQRKHASAAIFRGDKRYEANVHVMKAEVVTYRGISMVLNLLNAMQTVLDLGEWDFFMNISGSDYPLVSPQNQRYLLGTNDFLERNRSFFSFSGLDWWTESRGYRYERLFTDTSLSFNATESEVIDSYTAQPLSTMANFTYVAAEAWMILHRSFVTRLLHTPEARRMLLAFAYSLEPEEHYFVTLAYNDAEINVTTVPHALRFVAWVHEGKHAGQHPYYIDGQQEDGKTWAFGEELERSGCMFARKVRVQDSGFLKFIDRQLSGVGDEVDEGSVQRYLRRAQFAADCVAEMVSGQETEDCFGVEDFPER